MTETQLKQHPVILTRTGAVNQRLALRFSKLGFRTFAWPAFTIRLPEDETPVVKRFSDLSDIDLVLLVSPASVAAVAHWVDHWALSRDACHGGRGNRAGCPRGLG